MSDAYRIIKDKIEQDKAKARRHQITIDLLLAALMLVMLFVVFLAIYLGSRQC